jgi:hypothetical protein
MDASDVKERFRCVEKAVIGREWGRGCGKHLCSVREFARLFPEGAGIVLVAAFEPQIHVFPRITNENRLGSEIRLYCSMPRAKDSPMERDVLKCHVETPARWLTNRAKIARWMITDKRTSSYKRRRPMLLPPATKALYAATLSAEVLCRPNASITDPNIAWPARRSDVRAG